MNTNEYQEFIIDTFFATLSMCKGKNYTVEMFSVIGKDMKCLINHYASMYKHNDTYENLWQNSKLEFYKTLLMSENAHRIVANNEGSYQSYKTAHKRNAVELLYWEHITPNEVVWKRICNVYNRLLSKNIEENNLRDEVKKCFSNHKLVLLTQSEGNKLDKVGGRTGEKIKAVCDKNGITSYNVAEQRINLLLDRCNAKCLYLDDTRLEKNYVLDNNCNFIGSVKDYFTNDNFVIK